MSALQQTQETLDNLETQRFKLLAEMEQLTDSAKQAYKEDKKAEAQNLIRKRALLQAKVSQLDGMIFKLEQTHGMMESAAVAADVFEAQKHSTQAFANVTKKIDVEDVREVDDELRGQMRDAEELMKAVSQPIGGVKGIKQEDIDAEMRSWGPVELPNVPQTRHTPSAAPLVSRDQTK